MKACTACFRLGINSTSFVEVLVWADESEARQALAELMCQPCSRRCAMRHLAVMYDNAAETWRCVGPPEPPPPTLSELLRELYPRDCDARDPERWPLDPMNDEPLGCPARHNGVRNRARNGERLALAQGLAR